MLVSLNEILPKAQKEGYAVGLFNTIDTDMLEGVLSAAEELRDDEAGHRRQEYQGDARDDARDA